MHIHNGRKHVRDSGVKLFRSIFFRFLLIFPRRQRDWATRAAVVAVVHWSDRYVRQILRFVNRRFLFSLYVYCLIEWNLRIKASQQDMLQIYFKERTKYLPPEFHLFFFFAALSRWSNRVCHGSPKEYTNEKRFEDEKERQRSRWKTDQRLERFGFPEEAPRIRSRQSEASPNRVQKWRDRFGRWSARQGEMEAGKKITKSYLNRWSIERWLDIEQGYLLEFFWKGTQASRSDSGVSMDGTRTEGEKEKRNKKKAYSNNTSFDVTRGCTDWQTAPVYQIPKQNLPLLCVSVSPFKRSVYPTSRFKSLANHE